MSGFSCNTRVNSQAAAFQCFSLQCAALGFCFSFFFLHPSQQFCVALENRIYKLLETVAFSALLKGEVKIYKLLIKDCSTAHYWLSLGSRKSNLRNILWACFIGTAASVGGCPREAGASLTLSSLHKKMVSPHDQQTIMLPKNSGQYFYLFL